MTTYVAPAPADWHLHFTEPGTFDEETGKTLRGGWALIATLRDGDAEDVLVELTVGFAVDEEGAMDGQAERAARALHRLLVEQEHVRPEA